MQDSDFKLLDDMPYPLHTPRNQFRVISRKKQAGRHPASRRGRARDGQAFLNGPRARCTRLTVMHPRIKTQNDRSWTMADYVSVPRVSTHGTFNFGDMLNDDSIGNLLRAYSLMKRGN